MIPIVKDGIEEYAAAHTTPAPPWLVALAEETERENPRAVMMVGPLEGRFLDTIAALDGPFDLVFVDADKTNYSNYYEAVLPKLAERGLIVVDNTLWSGAVLDEADTSPDTEAIRAFNDHVRSDPRVVCVQLTVRDGVTLIRRV